MLANEREVVSIAEMYRTEVPSDFLREMDSVSADLASGEPLTIPRQKGGRKGAVKPTSEEVKAAIIDELRLLLCTNDPKYKSIRGQGSLVGKDVIHFIAGVIVASLGLASGMATGCVAFAVLACTKVGVQVFCRLSLPAESVTPTRKRKQQNGGVSG